MPADVLSPRAKFGVMGPSTNTIVQPEFDDMRPWGVTNHYSRILNSNAAAISNETFLAGTKEIWSLTLDAVRWVMNADPDYLIMAATFSPASAASPPTPSPWVPLPMPTPMAMPLPSSVASVSRSTTSSDSNWVSSLSSSGTLVNVRA